MTRSSRSRWCEAVWNAVLDPLGLNTRFDTSRDSLNEKMRVTSEASANACRSAHQLDVLLERIGHADGRVGQLPRIAARVRGFHLLDPPLDLPHVVQVVGQARLIGGRQLALQVVYRLGHPVQDAAVVAPPHLPRLGGGPDAKELVEHRARIAGHRHRIGWRGPADRVGVDAGVVVRAAPRLVDVLDAELHRGDRRLLAELLRVDLIERRAREHVRALRLLGPGLREEHGRGPEVIRADLGRQERLGVAAVGVADDGQVVAIGLERLEAGRRQVELAARWRPAPTCSS